MRAGLSPIKYFNCSASIISESKGTKMDAAPIPSSASPIIVRGMLVLSKLKALEGPKQKSAIEATINDIYVT